MLKRIQKILYIGRFVNCVCPGREFRKETIIFGYNAQGKSTLTEVLRSIQSGNNNILIGRKTFGATGNKYIEIDFDNNGSNDKYIFQNRTWNKTHPNILIFDSKFISENVFSGENVTFDQQKKLNTIIIGKVGQDLNSEIFDLKNLGGELAIKKSEKTREFASNFQDFDLAKFRSLPKDNKIDEKILNNDKEIKFESNKEIIKKSVIFHLQILSSIKFSIRTTLAKTLDIKQKEIEKHIKSHFSRTEEAQSFLRKGLSFLKTLHKDGLPRNCVFCGQELKQKAETLINSYSKFFKGGYEELQNEMNEKIDYFKKLNLEAILEKIRHDLIVNDIDMGLDQNKVSSVALLKNQFERELDKKRDLNYFINFNSFNKLEAEIVKIKRCLETLKTKLIKPSLKLLADLQKEKRDLEIIKKRYEPFWIKFCSDLEFIEKESERIKIAREEKRGQLNSYSLKIFRVHKATINKLCNEMGADFEIEDFKPLTHIVGNTERIFTIKFFRNYKVSINNENDQTPNFKNSMSESDKRLLAFAFFISLLMYDNKLNEKIVVFDDPMSSFDSERLRKTVQLIVDVVSKVKKSNGEEKVLSPKQKIVLTHDDRFAKEFLRLLPDSRTLKIVESSNNGQKKSDIIDADFSKDFPDDLIFNKIDSIKNILDSRDFSRQFEADCRGVLEALFKKKYYLHLKTEISNRKSVRTFITTLKQLNIGGYDDDNKFQDFSRLCDDLNIELHGSGGYNSAGDNESIIKDFFKCLDVI